MFLRELRRAAKAAESNTSALQKELSCIDLFGPARMKAGAKVRSRFAACAARRVAETRPEFAMVSLAMACWFGLAEVAMKLVVLDSFDLAFRIMQEYRLPTVEVFQSAIRTLGRAKQAAKVSEVLKNIKVRVLPHCRARVWL